MTYRHVVFIMAFILCMPLCGYSAPVQESEGVVEEPEDTGASMSETPRNAAPEKSAPPKNVPPEKKPGENMETGYNTVILQGLNKVTTRVSKIEAPIGSTVRFGALEIIPKSCWKSAPEDRPENAVLLEIFEIKQGEPPTRVFLGWMFSSSPGLSSLEHPFYDVSVIKCDRLEGGKL